MNYKLDKETAQGELERWFEAWGMEFDEDEMNQEEREDFDGLIKEFIFAIRKGRMILDDEEGKSVIKYVLRTPVDHNGMVNEIIIPMPKGVSLVEMDNQKEGHDIKKSFSMVGSLIKKPISFVNKMDERDIMFINKVNTLFLAS